MTDPTEPPNLASTPNVIPYVDPHDGPRRLLTIDISTHIFHAGAYIPFAGIDGRQYVVSWGAVSFEIPADRNVHVSVHLQSNGGAGYTPSPFASIILYPNPLPQRLATQFARTGMGALVPLP
jgi:hypothetical protein